MVLEALGRRINGALRHMADKTVIDDETLDEALKEIARALLEADVNVKHVSQLRRNVKQSVQLTELPPGANKRRIIQKAVFDELCRMLDPALPPPHQVRKGRANVIMFVGLQGNGKTTTCVKYAYHYKRRGYRSCLVCADTFRAGAFDQLKQNATKAKVPFYGSYEESDPVKIARDGVDRFKRDGYEVVIVDTSGRHKQEEALFEEMGQMETALQPDSVVFVMDGSMGQAAYDQALAFRQRVKVGSVIITKMDGHAKGGGALSAVAATHSPIIFIGTGEHIDELDEFRVQSFVGRLLGMGDVQGLVSTIQQAGLTQPNEDMVQRMTQGVFTLRDMQEQFHNISKLGPLDKVMSMFPGVSELMPAGSGQESAKLTQRMLTILDSFSDAELDDTSSVRFDDSRKRRVARGSGRALREVDELLTHYKHMSKMIGKMGKNMKGLSGMANAMGGGGAGGGAGGSMPNARAMEQQMSRMLDPRMLQQMGGQGGMQQMMRRMAAQFGGGGGGGGSGGGGSSR